MKAISLEKITALFMGTDLRQRSAEGTDLSSLTGQVVTRVATDSREAGPSCLFVALKGERFDGHDFVSQALDQGAVAALVCGDCIPALQGQLDSACWNKLISVPDTLLALGQLAGLLREELSIPVIGITGSVGKTSTKDFTACAFSPLGRVARTKLNFNNEIGLPLTVLSVEEQDRALVGEMGMRGLGEIQYLAEILKPDVGIITNIGVSHIERLGSRENIMLAKTEICFGMTEGSTLLVFGGDGTQDKEITRDMIRTRVASFQKNIQVKFFGTNPACDFWANEISIGKDGTPTFRFHPGGYRVSLQVAGLHNVNNALAALAAAYTYGVPMEQAVSQIEAYQGDSVRQHILQVHGITIIDDTYNAGPESMQAALAVLGTLPGITRKIAVLGSMLELGSASKAAHEAVCRAAVQNGIDILIAVGDTWGQSTADCPIAQKINCGSWKEAIPAIRYFCGDRVGKIGRTGDGFLVKGSHAMHMDEIVKVLTEGESAK